MTVRINELVGELTGHFPLALAFTIPAKRHGLELIHIGLHQRAVACIAEHTLLLVEGDEGDAEKLLLLADTLPLVTVIAENFISHLATREMGCKALWVEQKKAV